MRNLARFPVWQVQNPVYTSSHDEYICRVYFINPSDAHFAIVFESVECGASLSRNNMDGSRDFLNSTEKTPLIPRFVLSLCPKYARVYSAYPTALNMHYVSANPLTSRRWFNINIDITCRPRPIRILWLLMFCKLWKYLCYLVERKFEILLKHIFLRKDSFKTNLTTLHSIVAFKCLSTIISYSDFRKTTRGSGVMVQTVA